MDQPVLPMQTPSSATAPIEKQGRQTRHKTDDVIDARGTGDYYRGSERYTARHMTRDDVARVVEFADTGAWSDFYACAPRELVSQYGLHMEHVGPVVATMAEGVDSLFFNRVLGLGIAEPATEALLDTIITRYRRAGIERFAIQFSPAARPFALQEWLLERGLYRMDTSAVVYRGGESPPGSNGLRVERVGRDAAAGFAAIFCEVHGIPIQMSAWIVASAVKRGWHYYLAYDGKTPVATAAMWAHGDVGWLGLAATLPAYRRRGAQANLTARRIHEGAGLGCQWLVSEVVEDLPAMQGATCHSALRNCFRLAYLRPNYIHFQR